MTRAFCGDCLDAMRSMPDNAFSLAVCDPPYGIGEGGQKNVSRGLECAPTTYHCYPDVVPPPEVFREIFRVSKHQIIFGANHFISRIPFDASCWLVWDKQNGANDFADCELAWTSLPGAVRVFRFTWNGMLQGNPKARQVRIHPNEKPFDLYRWIFRKYAKPGDRILDPFLGSGSSRIAAHDMGLDFTGYEIDPEYFRLQEERFTRYAAQCSLFVNDAGEVTTNV